jgi:endonuclease/exonuclease/phosphatase (EEP) superfamily protein YafD
MNQRFPQLKQLFAKILFWAPIPGWLLLLLFGAALVRFHPLFSIIVALTPVITVIILVYYTTIFLFRKTKRNKVVLISILGIVLISYVDHWISFGASPNDDDIQIKVMTWNVQRLGALHNASVERENLNFVKESIQKVQPDVTVVEEISKRQLNRILQVLDLNSSHALWTNYYNGSKGGLAVILLNSTNWNISNKQIADLPPSWKCSMTELIHTSGQTINVLGVHIAPPKVTDAEVKTSVKKMLKGKRSGIKNILRRYVRQNNIQNSQLEKLNTLVSQFKDPTIIAGDFNSTNQLPLHKKLRASLTDTWLEGGNGIGATRYWAKVVPFRIDYIYTTQDFKVIKTETGSPEFSDHNPVITHLFLEK